jgi:hypothetical protein
VAKKDEEAAKEAAKDAEEAAAMNLVSISWISVSDDTRFYGRSEAGWPDEFVKKSPKT